MAGNVPPHQGWVRGPTIGRGATATVSLATCRVTGSIFAVKSVDLQHSVPLQREQRFLASIPPSPYVVPYLGFDVTAEGSCGAAIYNLFLEFVPGGSIADEITRRGKLEQSRLRGFARDILLGLAHLHSNGIAHCDVKPRNVLVTAEATGCKLGDLGCARWVGDGDSGGGDTCSISGSPMYMAPEVARGEVQGTATDVWALGCTVLEMATGRPPWPDAKDPVAALHRIGFSGDVPELPEGLADDVVARDFLGKCLVRDPVERWSAEELLAHPFASSSGRGGKGESKDGFSAFSLGDDDRNSQWRPSPKCVLDGVDLWGCSSSSSSSSTSSTSMGDFEAEDGQQHHRHPDVPTLSSTARDRIGQLAGGRPSSTDTWADASMSGSSWTWCHLDSIGDGDNDEHGRRIEWITIRGSGHSGGHTDKSPSPSSLDVEAEPQTPSAAAPLPAVATAGSGCKPPSCGGLNH